MTPDELLLWLSARIDGSWPQFRGAIERLDLAGAEDAEGDDGFLPIHQRIRFNLERLGHVEFGAAGCENGWRVVPPALALSEHKDGSAGVLCGARTVKLVSRIEQGAGGLSVARFSEPDCPDIFRLNAAGVAPLVEFAGREGLLCQIDAPLALLSRVPPVDTIGDWRHQAMPIMGKDWDVKRFIIEKKVVKWLPSTIQDANSTSAQGLFCFTRFQVPQYFLREGATTVRLPGAVGKYRILARKRRRILRYDRHALCLTVPAILRPPLLTERALVLCSGFPPSLSIVNNRPTLTYRDIPEEIAGLTAEVLRQDLS